MGHVNFHMNSKRNFPNHMSRPAFTCTSNDELFVNTRERLNCKFSVRYKWFAKFMIHKIKRFNFEFSKSLQYSLRKNFLPCNYSLAWMSPGEFNYADNWNFAEVYCSFSILDVSDKIARTLSTQFKLSKELWICEMRSVFTELQFFLLEPLAHLHVSEGIKLRRQ